MISLLPHLESRIQISGIQLPTTSSAIGIPTNDPWALSGTACDPHSYSGYLLAALIEIEYAREGHAWLYREYLLIANTIWQILPNPVPGLTCFLSICFLPNSAQPLLPSFFRSTQQIERSQWDCPTDFLAVAVPEGYRKKAGSPIHKFSATSKVILWIDNIPHWQWLVRLKFPFEEGQAYSCSRMYIP